MTEGKVARYRAKLKAAGVSQVNLMAPVSRHGQLRDIAKAMRDDPAVMVTYGGKVSSDPPVSSDLSPETQAVIDAYYARSRAKDPKSALERAVAAVVQRELLPQIDKAVRERVADEERRLSAWGKRLLDEEDRLDARAKSLNERAKTISGYMTRAEYKLILSCLHTDRDADPGRKDKAFKIMQRMAAHVDPLTPIKILREQGWEDIAPEYRRKRRKASV